MPFFLRQHYKYSNFKYCANFHRGRHYSKNGMKRPERRRSGARSQTPGIYYRGGRALVRTERSGRTCPGPAHSSSHVSSSVIYAPPSGACLALQQQLGSVNTLCQGIFLHIVGLGFTTKNKCTELNHLEEGGVCVSGWISFPILEHCSVRCRNPSLNLVVIDNTTLSPSQTCHTSPWDGPAARYRLSLLSMFS